MIILKDVLAARQETLNHRVGFRNKLDDCGTAKARKKIRHGLQRHVAGDCKVVNKGESEHEFDRPALLETQSFTILPADRRSWIRSRLPRLNPHGCAIRGGA